MGRPRFHFVRVAHFLPLRLSLFWFASTRGGLFCFGRRSKCLLVGFVGCRESCSPRLASALGGAGWGVGVAPLPLGGGSWRHQRGEPLEWAHHSINRTVRWRAPLRRHRNHPLPSPTTPTRYDHLPHHSPRLEIAKQPIKCAPRRQLTNFLQP